MQSVFHIISKCDLGGAEQVASYLATSQNHEFYYHVCEVYHTDTSYSKVFRKELEEKNVQVHSSPWGKKKWAILFFPFLLFRLVLKHRPSVIHTHTEVPDFSVFIFYRLLAPFLSYKIKCIRTIHNTVLWNKWKKIGGMVERFYAGKAIPVAISPYVKENYIRLYGHQHIPVIPNGVPPVSGVEKFPFLKKGKVNVLFAGRFDYQKGVDTLICVVNALQTNDNYYFHIVGDGPLKEKIISSLTGPNYKMYDTIFRISRYLSSFDFLFMPSLFEGLSILAIEACMNKTLLIAHACKGIADVVPPSWELLVKDNSVEGYLYVFERIVPSLDYALLAERVFEHAQENFSLDQMRKGYEKLYHSC